MVRNQVWLGSVCYRSGCQTRLSPLGLRVRQVCSRILRICQKSAVEPPVLSTGGKHFGVPKFLKWRHITEREGFGHFCWFYI